MKKVSKVSKVVSLAVVVLLGLSVAASAETVISSGPDSKSFTKMADNLVGLIGRDKNGVAKASNLPSFGSDENLVNLISGKAQIGFVFADSYKLKLGQDPRAAKLKVLGVLNKGCLYTVVKDGGKIKDDGDLEKTGVKVDIGPDGAGSNTTWQYLGSFDADFKKPETIQLGGGDPASLNALDYGTIDATLSMQVPSTTNTLVQDVLANKNLKFLPITDGDFTDKLPDGKQIYTKEKILIKSGSWSDTTLSTICTDVLVLGGESLTVEDYKLVSALIYRNKAAITGAK